MTATAASPVIAGTGAVFAPATGAVVSDPYPLYTLTTGQVIRIESVFVEVDYDDAAATGDNYILRFLDPTGLVLYAYPTNILSTSSVPNCYFSWARGASDQTGTSGETIQPAGIGEAFYLQAMPLPDLVLTGSSQITFQAIRGGSGDATGIAVTNVAITYTDVGSIATDNNELSVLPLLVPQTTG